MKSDNLRLYAAEVKSVNIVKIVEQLDYGVK